MLDGTYEILNTEMRSLLFMFSYGYQLSVTDFGQLKGITGVNIKDPMEKVYHSTMKLLYRELGIIRIKVLKTQEILQREAADSIDEDDEGDLYSIENAYTMYSFFDDSQCLLKGEVFVYLKL